MVLPSLINSLILAVLVQLAEKYTLPGGTEGRYVRITVNGNTENDWASINEISVFGGATSGGGGGGGSNVIGTLFHKLQTTAGGSTWSPYSSLSGDVAPDTDSAIAMNSDGRLQVLIVGANNQVYYKTQTAAGSSTWTGWTSLGGGIKADTSPAVARNSDGRLQVFVVGTNNQLYYKTQTAARQQYMVFSMDIPGWRFESQYRSNSNSK